MQFAKSAVVVVAVIFLGMGLASSPASTHEHSGSVVDVETWVQEALRANPHIDAGKKRAAAVSHRIESAGAWSDPTLTVAFNNVPLDPFALDATPMTGVRIGVQQSIPWPGKLASREAVVAHGADAATQAQRESENQLSAAVRRAYYRLHLTDVTRHVIDENLRIVEGLVGAADAKYKVGRGLQQDILKARVVRDQLRERALELERRRRAHEIGINRLLARRDDTKIPLMTNVAVSSFPSTLDAAELVALALEARPVLQELEAQASARTAEAVRYEKDYFPDVQVGLAYTIRQNVPGDPVNGADFLSASVGVRIPVFGASRLDPMVRAAEEERGAYRAEIDDAILEIRRTVDSALYEIPKTERQMLLFRDSIIPTMQQTLAADQIAYQTDQADFQDLLDIELRLLDFEVQFHELHVTRELLIVNLAHAIGVAPSALAALSKEAQP